jgi:outer membrane protein OmpA-like peptidoglycan-associated protein/predicted  nucleic acid-binding Zn-ribbon protein
MFFDLCGKRAVILGILSLISGACPVLLPTGDLAAQSNMPADRPAPVVRQIADSVQRGGQAGDPAVPAQAGQTGTPKASPSTELNEALVVALEALSGAAGAAASVHQELQTVQEQNQLLTSDLARLRENGRELQNSNEAAKVRIAELTAAAQNAVAEIRRLSGENEGLRGENAKLSAALASTEEALSQAADKANAALAAQREKLTVKEQEATAASAGRQQAEARLEELQRAIHKIEQEAGEHREQIAKAQDALASAERERQEAKATVGQLRSRLAAAEQRVNELEATSAGLSAELQAFQTAATNAADVVRQNLKTIKSRVEALIAEPTGTAKGAPEAPTPGSAETGQGEPRGGQAILIAARPGRHLGGNDQKPAAAKAKEPDQPIDEQAVAAPPELDPLTANLPFKRKLQIQTLLTELKPEVDQRGLQMSIPGGALFRTNSDEIEQTSYPTLAKLAELINASDGRQVLIVGHTDATGEAAYNQILSKRRADLIKQFFVDNFDIDAARLVTEGKGEETPIASNGTPDGREANRRVDVLLLD